jgi:hypothetical protein
MTCVQDKEKEEPEEKEGCDGIVDECGVCGGSGIPIGDCDCNGNQDDECGVCGGSGIPIGDCDCNGNQDDDCGVCGGNNADKDSCGVCFGSSSCTSTSTCEVVDTIFAGKTEDVGTVSISADFGANTLTVTVVTSSNPADDTQINVNNVDEGGVVDTDGSFFDVLGPEAPARPPPGKAGYNGTKVANNDAAYVKTFTFDLTGDDDVNDDCFYIVTHISVDGETGYGADSASETNGFFDGNGGAWWFYKTFCPAQDCSTTATPDYSQGTCVNSEGGTYCGGTSTADPNNACSCQDVCDGFSNCCGDYETVCLEAAEESELPMTCAGNCGLSSTAVGCTCDPYFCAIPGLVDFLPSLLACCDDWDVCDTVSY